MPHPTHPAHPGQGSPSNPSGTGGTRAIAAKGTPGWALAGAVCAALVLVAPSPAALAQSGAAAPVTAELALQRLSAVWVYPQRQVAAQVVARNTSRLSAEVGGRLLAWHADVGQTVKKGQRLAEIDPTDLRLALQRAQAQAQATDARVALAKGQLERAEALVKQGFFSPEALAQRQTELALLQAERSAQQAELASARRQLEKTQLRAPFTGTVQARLAQAGETVPAGSALFVLVENGAHQLSAALAPPDVAGLRADPAPRFTADAASHRLRLLQIDPNPSLPARTQTARLAFVGPEPAPSAGTSGQLQWRDPRPHIGPQLQVRRGDQLGIFVADGQQRARFVPLPGAQEGRSNPLPAGLDGQTQVVVRGQAGLQNGQALALQAPATPSQPPTAPAN